MPPSFMLTLYGNDEAFKQKYLTKDNLYYITGDAGFFDEEGNLHILNRTDDVINTAGHRLSCGRIEEVIMNIQEITESAVVGVYDKLKGEVPFAFIVLNSGINISDEKKIKSIIKKAKENVVEKIGAISRVKEILVVEKLPKTKSGKIVRACIKKIINKEEYVIPKTLEDKDTLIDLIELLRKMKYI
jgi:propionyl-CoA synthetase